MRKPTRNEVSLWLLIAALVFNAWVHWTSPAYRYYREEFEKVRESEADFRRRVEDEFVPSIREVVTSGVYRATSPGVPGSSGLPSVGSVELVDDYRHQAARIGGYSVEGCYIDGHFYRLGDRYLGSPLLAVEPSCAFTRDFVIRPSRKVRADPPKPQAPASPVPGRPTEVTTNAAARI